ncbi:J domain-containing protein [Roseomonas sp. GC11]|uniref:J domain-containing protein n=1 Tax=Roseomonas sp. GC11 TaxID=2950546 RepID=UPI00210E7439|nr:J domain-containing protein [Roseomonas sp. GC11]MCQ4161677.1 J domain-containing protein [Roseomonas sp. GC11]
MAGLVRLLGIAPAEAAEAVRLAVGRVAGPALTQHREGDCVAIAQLEPSGPRGESGRVADAARLRALHQVQRRLEAACMAGPFLPASPAAALCPAAELPALLAAAAPRLRLALEEDAGTHQWQLALRWPAEALLALRREMIAAELAALGAAPEAEASAMAAALAAALAEELAYRAAAIEAALKPALRSLRREPAGQEGELRFLLLVPRGGEAAIEDVLHALPQELSRGAVAELQGPMPPVNFHAWEVAEAEEQALRAAWALLGLPERVDAEALRRRWRDRATDLHPDAGGVGDGGQMAQMQGAYRLLAPLFAGAQESDLATLLPRARRRLVPSGLAAVPARGAAPGAAQGTTQEGRTQA